jgi:hypothetical protein
MAGLHRTSRSGLFLSLNYTFAHAINNLDNAPENFACRSCSKGNAAFDRSSQAWPTIDSELPPSRHVTY